MPGKTFIIIISLLLGNYLHAQPQKKWAGAIAGLWDNASNWQPLGIPATSDDIVLDNSIQQNNYTISLPDTTVDVHTLLIEPAGNNTIELTLPPSNKSSPALIINAAGTSFTIRKGGTFKNSSGLTAGQSIQLSGVLTIYDGGRFIHNSRSSHASEIVARLSAAPGTENGIFEFDVPGGSYPISFSGRIYGTLVLSSDASGGSQTYNASGTSQTIINGSFHVNNGVTFNLDLTKDLTINGDYIQSGGIFNVATQPNSNVVKIKGNIYQSAPGSITETSGGFPVLELCGNVNQQAAFAGNIANDITLKINNPKGIVLVSPLKLFYKLVLTKGTVKTSRINLLTVMDNCVVSGGSEISFVDGPIMKVGDDDFEFPIGKQGDYAPAKIMGANGAVTDQYQAEYFLDNPQTTYGSSFERPPVIRISKLEFWRVEKFSGNSIKKINFHVGKYSNATALENLVIVGWDSVNQQWKNCGNSAYTGIAVGTLASSDLTTFGAFTLGSTAASQNPLLAEDKSTRHFDNEPRHQPIRVSLSGVLMVQAFRREQIHIIVTDVTGKRIMLLKYALSTGMNTIPLQLSNLVRGVYYITMYTSGVIYASILFVKI